MRRLSFVAAGVLLAVLGATADHAGARSLADEFNRKSDIGQLFVRSLAKSIARAIPVHAASAGMVYRYDPVSGAFVRDVNVLGQLFLERADPIGKHRLNVSVSYQHVALDTLEGKDLEHLHDEIPLGEAPDTFTIARFGVDLDTQQVTASATYGVTDDLEVNITVPVIYSDLGVDLVVRGLAQPPIERHASKVGIGDLFLRGKYRLLAEAWAQAAFGLALRLPTGDPDDFQGTGAVDVSPMLYLSRPPTPLGRHLRWQPYMNAGVVFDTEDVGESETRWGLGVDCGVGRRFTAAVAVLGRHAFARPGRPGLFDRPRSGPVAQAPLFGIQPQRPDFYDLSVGGRLNLWRDTVIGFANVLVPLNRDGFRADVIPLVGLEATF